MRIVDATVQTFGVEAKRIGNAQQDHLPIDKGHEAVLQIGRGNRHVLREAAAVHHRYCENGAQEIVDPSVVLLSG
jgi:hypothetical protein